MRVFVTGATGFIGNHLCHRLVREGHQVVALVRNPEKAKSLPQENVDILRGDLSLFKDEQLILPACDIVIHLAGVVAAQSQREYRAVNHDAVIDLLDCLKRQSWKPRRLLFASTLAAVGPSTPGMPKTEQDPAVPIDAYGQAKLEAEHYLNQNAPFPVTSFRPGAVYGPGDPALLTVFKMGARGLGIRVAGNNQLFSYIYVDDLVDAIMKLAEDEGGGHKTYFTVYPAPVTIQEMWDLMSVQMKRKIRLAPIPAPLLYIAMLASTVLSKILRYKNQMDVKQFQQLMVPAFTCSSEAMQRDFDWTPKYNMEACIEKTATGYREAGWL